jgi:transcriptional regulator with XRE-family HTH domain
MVTESTLTDARVLELLGARLRRHRLDLDLTQARLAREAGVSKSTVERLEAGRSIQLGGLLRILRVLGLLPNLDALVPAPLPSPLVERPRERARNRRTPATAWTWGDE